MKEIIARFFLSPMGIAVFACNFLLAILLVLLHALPLPLAVLAAFVLFAVETLLLLQTRFGAGAVVAERERLRLEEETRALAAAAEARNRLALLRVDDPALEREIQRICLASGRYLENAARGEARDPDAEDALLGAVPLVNDYLRLKDADLSRRRIEGASDATQGDLEHRLLESLKEAGDRLERSLSAATGAEAIADRQGAREELK